MGRQTLNVDSILPQPGALDWRKRRKKASSHQHFLLSTSWCRHNVSSGLMCLLPSPSCHGGLHPQTLEQSKVFLPQTAFVMCLWQRCGRQHAIVYSILCTDVYQRVEHFYPIVQTQTRVFQLPYNPLCLHMTSAQRLPLPWLSHWTDFYLTQHVRA